MCALCCLERATGVGQEAHVPCSLDRLGDLALLTCRSAQSFAGVDLPVRGHQPAKFIHRFVIHPDAFLDARLEKVASTLFSSVHVKSPIVLDTDLSAAPGHVGGDERGSVPVGSLPLKTCSPKALVDGKRGRNLDLEPMYGTWQFVAP